MKVSDYRPKSYQKRISLQLFFKDFGKILVTLSDIERTHTEQNRL